MYSRNKSQFLVAGLLLLCGSLAFACAVPVYRYGLERWEPDDYQLYFLYEKEISPEDQKTLDFLEDNSTGARANLRVSRIDVSAKDDLDDDARSVLDQCKPGKFPYSMICYPETAAKRKSFWEGAISRELAGLLVDSPARREIARRLLSGEAGVWIFIEGPDKERNTMLYEKLSSGLKKIEDELNRRPPREPDEEKPPPGFEENVMAMPVKTSVLKIPKDDPSEKMLMRILEMFCPEKMAPAKFPVAVPVFSRGRMLDIVDADSIDIGTMSAVMDYLTGECSCEVKAMNPGIDLLITADWEKLAYGRIVPEQETPPLQGLGNIDQTPAGTVVHENVAPKSIPWNLRMPVAIAAAIVLSFIIAAFAFGKYLKK